MNNKSIQFLRGEQVKINNHSTEQLLPGQPLYNLTHNYLSIGDDTDASIVTKEPIAVKELHGNFTVDSDSTDYDYSIKAIDSADADTVLDQLQIYSKNNLSLEASNANLISNQNVKIKASNSSIGGTLILEAGMDNPQTITINSDYSSGWPNGGINIKASTFSITDSNSIDDTSNGKFEFTNGGLNIKTTSKAYIGNDQDCLEITHNDSTTSNMLLKHHNQVTIDAEKTIITKRLQVNNFHINSQENETLIWHGPGEAGKTLFLTANNPAAERTTGIKINGYASDEQDKNAIVMLSNYIKINDAKIQVTDVTKIINEETKEEVVGQLITIFQKD